MSEGPCFSAVLLIVIRASGGQNGSNIALKSEGSYKSDGQRGLFSRTCFADGLPQRCWGSRIVSVSTSPLKHQRALSNLLKESTSAWCLNGSMGPALAWGIKHMLGPMLCL